MAEEDRSQGLESRETRGQDHDHSEGLEGLDDRSKLNWAINASIVSLLIAFSVYRLITNDRQDGDGERSSSLFTLLLHVLLAVTFTGMLMWCYGDSAPMVTEYRVAGRPEIEMVRYEFVHHMKWTTFTVWTNTLTAIYFWLSALFDIFSVVLGRQVPGLLSYPLVPIWGCILPLSFLVNIVVSLALIPAVKGLGDPSKLDGILSLRTMFLHNGLVLATSLEFLCCTPVMHQEDFPIVLLYGLAYVLFSWAVFMNIRVFHYFFMDPRFLHAPCGLVGLLVLITSLFLGFSFLTYLARRSIFAGVAVFLAALITYALWTWQLLAQAAGRGPNSVAEAEMEDKLTTEEVPSNSS